MGLYEKMKWQLQRDEESAKTTFEDSLRGLPPEIRMFCLLKSEANFGVKIKGNCIQNALKMAVDRSFLTEAQRKQYIAHIEKKVENSMLAEGRAMDLDEESKRLA